MPRPAPRSPEPARWTRRWASLARGVGLDPTAPVVLALSGGADSVFLLHTLAAAEAPAPSRILCVHVAHELRGAESRDDQAFCERLCATLGVDLSVRRAPLDPESSSLEERARHARYAELVAVARAEGIATILTGHHEDDALETLLMRLLRGTDLAGLGKIPTRTTWRGGAPARRVAADAVAIVRPLTALRREEVRTALGDWGLAWREDSSNSDPRFTRNKVRHAVVPWLRSVGGEAAVDNLRAFANAIDELEGELARSTVHLAWTPLQGALDFGHGAALGLRTVPRGALARLPVALRRRALWRLVVEGTGRAPSRALVELLLDDVRTARCTRRALPGRYSLQLRSDALLLIPPSPADAPRAAADAPAADTNAPSARGPHPGQLEFAFGPPEVASGERLAPRALPLPGVIELPDGRRLSAEIVLAAVGEPVSRDPRAVELDAEGLNEPLLVRWSRPGDRFHPLGAPGSKPLRRFLADAGVPREERDRIPLVFAGRELLWAAGVRPCESRRVRGTTKLRLRLVLRDPDVRPA